MNDTLKSAVIEFDEPKVKKVNKVILRHDPVSPKFQIPFWTNDPNILFQPPYIFEFFPMEQMSYEQKLNSVTRSVIVLTIVGVLFSKKLQILAVSAVTLFAIFIMHYYHDKEQQKLNSKKLVEEIKEGFDNPNPAMDYLKDNNIPIDPSIFAPPSSANPFSNVLISDYDFNPNKKPAQPAFNTNTNQQIVSSTKQLVDEANPDYPDISKKLYKDLGDELEFEQSLRQFNSNPATTIPNDQGAFAEFCYGSMISCKEGNLFACARNQSRYNNY
jgi:hypothetical protein